MSVKDDTRATPEPVAPPSPDIAGLVERLEKWGKWLDADIGWDEPAGADLREAATALQRVAQERDAANQLNNKYAWERDKAREERDAAERRSEAFWKPQIAAAEARIATARDEGLEPLRNAMAGAFITANSDGANSYYAVHAKFRTLKDMQRAHEAIIAAVQETSP